MKILKIIGIVVLVLAVICVVGGLLLPSTWEVNTSVVIDAPMERIHEEIATPRNFVQHAEAHAKSTGHASEFTYTFSEQETGKGAWWISESGGSRVQIWITDEDPAKGMWYEGAIEQEEVNDHGSITYEEVDGGVKVTWDDRGDVGGVIGGWAGPLISGALEPYFHGILQQVKQTCEAE